MLKCENLDLYVFEGPLSELSVKKDLTQKKTLFLKKFWISKNFFGFL